MTDANCLDKFEDNDVILPTVSIRELNNNKNKDGAAAKAARDFTNYLDALEGDIYEGVTLQTGGTFTVMQSFPEIAKEIEAVFHELDKDEYIISVAIHLHREYEKKKSELEEKLKTADEKEEAVLKEQLAELKPVVLVSRDNNVRLKAKKFKVTAETYFSDNIEAEELYSGFQVVPVSDDLINQYVIQKSKLSREGREEYEILHPELKELSKKHTFLENEYVIFVSKDWVDTPESREVLFKDPNIPVVRHKTHKGKSVFVGLITLQLLLSKYNIFPRNLHQTIVVDVLADPHTTQKSIVGGAGSGKTLFALLVSMILTNDLGIYDEIIITRPPVEAEFNLGFLPGGEAEKMDPYLRGFHGNLKYIVNQMNKGKHKSVKAREKEKNSQNGQKEEDEGSEYAFAKYNIRTESMGYMRGETTFRQIYILDETQNSTSRSMKTALTRNGAESMMIILGDITQIDYYLVDAMSNGLAHGVEIMKDDDLASHVTLQIGERSELSKRISEKWDQFVAQKGHTTKRPKIKKGKNA